MSTIILDIDSDTIRVGYGGDALPRISVTICIGTLTAANINTVLNTIFTDLLQAKIKVSLHHLR